jgi:hypothetical protein
MISAPHFDLPFRFSGGSAVVNEQGSEGDVAACVYAACATEPGALLDRPTFGVPDITFSQEPIQPSALLGPISRCEPRARILAQINPSRFDAAVVNANIEIQVAR